MKLGQSDCSACDMHALLIDVIHFYGPTREALRRLRPGARWQIPRRRLSNAEVAFALGAELRHYDGLEGRRQRPFHLARRALEAGGAAERLWRHTLQHHRAKALARRPIWLAVAGIGTRRLLPDKVKPALCLRTGLDRPGDLDMTTLTRQRAIFRRVGAEFVESHAEILHGVGLQRQQGT